MRDLHCKTFDILYIDCSLHTSMSIRWEKREITQDVEGNHPSNYRLLQQASTMLSTYDIKQSRSEKLPLICDELRKHCNGEYETLKAVCVCIGPGSFTGTRSSLAFAKGLCCGNSATQLITLTSFHIIAQAYCTCRPLLALCDARSNRYVYQLFTQEKNTEIPQNIELLDIHTLHSKIQSLLKEHTTLYIAGEPAVSIYEQLHTQYKQDYTSSSLSLPYIQWEQIQVMHSMSIAAFQKFISKDFSNIDCVPLYGKHYI